MFLYEKAVFFEMDEQADRILECPNWYQLKTITLNCPPSSEWQTHALTSMQTILRHKLDQCVDFRNELANSKGKPIYVCGDDKYWTCGINERLARVTDPDTYPGNNSLGKLLFALAAQN